MDVIQAFIDDFNPRTHKECDKTQMTELGDSMNFNPRTHKECDRLFSSPLITLPNFNPRTHKECDNKFLAAVVILSDFNPRTHKECDQGKKQEDPFQGKFQSTHSQGVRLVVQH